MAYILSWPQFGHEKMPLPRTALFASWTHKFVHHRCESPCVQRTGTNCLGIVQKNSWGTVKNLVNWCHMLANINIGGSITAAGIAAIHYRQVLQYPRAASASALALAYRSININHNKRPRPTGFWQCLPHSLPVWPGYVRILCPLCPLFSATVSFLMDASQQQQQQRSRS